MNYIDEIFARANLQQIRSFLIDGIEDLTPDTRPYVTRIEGIQKQCIAKLREDYADNDQCNEMIALMTNYVTVVQDVYTEIGLQIGAKLTAEYFENTRTMNK